MAVDWLWSGAIDTVSGVVVAKLTASATACRLAVSTAANMASPSYGASAAPDANNYVKLASPTLTANTQYWYQVEIDGTLDTGKTGKLKTLPSGQSDFTIAFTSCTANSSNHIIHDVVRAKTPLMLVYLGDFQYPNITTNNQALYRAAIEGAFAQAKLAQFYREIPVAYVWDDHDFGPDNCDTTNPGRPAAAAVYRQTVPSYPLAASGDTPIYQAFTIGRIRFLLTDNRHQRSPNANTDDASKTMLGATQKQWFKDQLDAAQADATIKAVVWGNGQCWCGNLASLGDGDGWGAFTTERTELATFITGHLTKPIIILSGDQHGISSDDGSGSSASIPVFQGGAFDQTGVLKGGPYSGGSVINASGDGAYGLLTVEDRNDQLRLIVRLFTVTAAGVEKEQITHFVQRPAFLPIKTF